MRERCNNNRNDNNNKGALWMMGESNNKNTYIGIYIMYVDTYIIHIYIHIIYNACIYIFRI